jgi:hypothetical protein
LAALVSSSMNSGTPSERSEQRHVIRRELRQAWAPHRHERSVGSLNHILADRGCSGTLRRQSGDRGRLRYEQPFAKRASLFTSAAARAANSSSAGSDRPRGPNKGRWFLGRTPREVEKPRSQTFETDAVLTRVTLHATVRNVARKTSSASLCGRATSLGFLYLCNLRLVAREGLLPVLALRLLAR